MADYARASSYIDPYAANFDDEYQRVKPNLDNPYNQNHQDNEIRTMPCCEQSQVDIDLIPALVIMILNILVAGFGSFLSGFIDKKGLNFYAMAIGIA